MAELLLIVPSIIFGTHMEALDEGFNFGSSVKASYFKPLLDFSLTRRRRNFRTRRFGFSVVARLLWFFRYVVLWRLARWSSTTVLWFRYYPYVHPTVALCMLGRPLDRNYPDIVRESAPLGSLVRSRIFYSFRLADELRSVVSLQR